MSPDEPVMIRYTYRDEYIINVIIKEGKCKCRNHDGRSFTEMIACAGRYTHVLKEEYNCESTVALPPDDIL